MKSLHFSFFFILLIGYLSCQNSVVTEEFKTKEPAQKEVLPIDKLNDILLPQNFKRDSTSKYGDWIRNLKLKKDNTVYYYNGEKKPNQSIHVAVLEFDIGNRDLQQCADACMRIRAEYLFKNKKHKEIKFLLASGKWKSFFEYTSKRDYNSFRKYLNFIFSYANTASLKKQLKRVKNFQDIQPGDIFVQSGIPYGHAVTVMDVCIDSLGNKQFILSQSYMPAQSIEILINPNSNSKSPWYPVDFEGDLVTPEWVFQKENLMRF